jgi:hypothetical protein
MHSLNDMSPFGINPIIKLCRLSPKWTILYNLRQSITYDIRAIA